MKNIVLMSGLTSIFLFAQEIQTLDKSVVSGNIVDTNDISWNISEFQAEQPTKSVSLIDRRALLEANNGTGGIQAALESVPGIVYARTSGLGGQISIRGMNSNNTRSIIAIDGVKVRGRSTLEFNLIDPMAVDSIEIIRGAASTIYGSSAMNGVVNFKTRRFRGDVNAPFSIVARVRSLEYNTVNYGTAGRVELIGGGDGWDILLGAHGRNASNFRTPDGVTPDSHYQSYGADFNIGYTKGKVRYYAQGRFQSASSHDAASVFNRPGTSYDAHMKEDPLTEHYLRAGVEIYDVDFADKIDTFAYLRRYNTDIWVDTLAIGGSYYHRKVYDTYSAGGRIHFDKKYFGHELSYGLNIDSAISPKPLTDEYLTPNPRVLKNSRDTMQIEIAPYIKDDYAITKSLILSGALRYDYIIIKIGDKHSSVEDAESTGEITSFLDSNSDKTTGAFTGSVGATYFINNRFSFVANAAQSFLSPGTSGMFPNATTEANLDLKSETAQTYEIGGRIHDKNHYASLVFYRTNYTDMIQSVLLTNGKTQSQNVGEAYVQGIELESKHRFYDIELGLSGAYTYGQNKTANCPLSYISPFTGRIQFAYHLPFGSAKWIQRYYQGKTRIDITQERKTSSYTMSDVNFAFHLGYFNSSLKDMDMIVGIENLFNQKGRNPATQENIRYAQALTNPLLEPGINGFVKFVYNY